MDEGAFSSLDQKALLAICGQLDGRSLAVFQTLNHETRRAAEADIAWREAYRREFPLYFSQLEQERYFGARNFWKEAYKARQRAERCWSDNSTLEPIEMLKNPGRSLLSIEFLQDPLPTNLALSGALVDSTQAGEFTLYNLDAIRNRDHSALAQEVVSIKKRPGRSSSLSAGIFHVAQRTGTNQLAVTTLSTEAHILRLLEKNKNEDDLTTDTGDDVDMMDVEENGSNQNSTQNENNTSSRGENSGASTSWELDVEYDLKGHTGGCAAVRICNNKAVTACFDGCLRVFDLPQISSNYSYINDDEDVFNATTSTSTATKFHGSYTTTANTNNNKITNAMYQPAALHPIATFMDDPEHAQQPPLNEQNRGVCGLALSSSADRIVSGSNDMQIKVWDSSTGRITLRLVGCMGWPWWVEGLDPELTQVASASTDGFVRVWDLRAGQQSLDVNLGSDPNSSIFPVATVVPRVDGNYLVAGCFDTAIYVIDRRMGSVVKDLRGHTERLARLALRGDSLLSCAFDGDVGLWDF